mgnify:CR=1 FL=1
MLASDVKIPKGNIFDSGPFELLDDYTIKPVEYRNYPPINTESELTIESLRDSGTIVTDNLTEVNTDDGLGEFGCFSGLWR